jgi:hypothetical protein
MNVIQTMDQHAYDYFKKIDPKLWSRHTFKTTCKSDMLLNNLAETFNTWIKDARDKLILTMMEMIRRQLMMRFQQKRDGARQASHTICPKIHKKLERSKDDARNCICRWQNELEFEVDHMYDARRVVNLDSKTCTCGRWKLNGILCSHVCSAIYMNKHVPEMYLVDCYRMNKYIQAYEPRMQAMPDPDEWLQINTNEDILPPRMRPRLGRPKKARRGADEEVQPYKVSRDGYDVKCGNCGVVGHNFRTYPQPENPTRKKWPKKTKKKKSKDNGGYPATATNSKSYINVISLQIVSQFV